MHNQTSSGIQFAILKPAKGRLTFPKDINCCMMGMAVSMGIAKEIPSVPLTYNSTYIY